MSLKTYSIKRDFEKTREPEPKKIVGKKQPTLEFVVQKHQARTLHYDLRLEVNGVLKSWAVPKGPSLNPADKRLAIQVEDHPFEYRKFEGSIPQGSYGAGDVIIWDAGTYDTEGSDNIKAKQAKIEQDLEKGHLDFTLSGKKLNGAFVLIHTKANQWLLMKKNDEFASRDDITFKDQSIISDRPVVLKEKPEKNKASDKRISIGVKESFPKEIKPMLASTTDKAFDSDEWIYELKWDGYRAMGLLHNEKALLVSRNGLSFTHFQSVSAELSKLPFEACFDGEIVTLDRNNRPSFQQLQNYLNRHEGSIVYYIFDLVYYNGRNLKNVPLIERKALLRSLIPENNPVLKYSDHVEEKGIALFKEVAEQNLEGIIAKKKESVYLEGKRSKSWLKIKTHMRQEVIICGFTPPKGSRKFFGSLLLGVYEKDNLIYAGHTGTGFDEKKLEEIYKRLSPLVQTQCPFSKKPPKKESVTWVKPRLVCEVSFAEWTDEKIMRHAVFIDFREDKKPREVTKEKEIPVKEVIKQDKKQDENTSKSPKKAIPNDTQDPQLKLTNLDKVFWPKEGYTKGDLIDYYRQVSTLILPYLKDRPESLRRFPNGIEQPGFFQKDAVHAPSWMRTVSIHHGHENRDVNYYVIEKEKELLYLVNLGCIDFNPFLSRVQSLHNPDYLVIDLDPEDIAFEKVIEVAQGVHEILESKGVPSVCKTSGKRGMHIYIPLGAKYSYEDAVNFGKLIAYVAHDKMPDITSVERSPKNRQKKVYLDYLQTNFGQTLAAPYSVRPNAGATVSTPLNWSEVKSGLSPDDFNIRNAVKRFKKTGDLFQPVLGRGIDLKKVLKKF